MIFCKKHSTWKLIVSILVSVWQGVFSGAMSVSRSVISWKNNSAADFVGFSYVVKLAWSSQPFWNSKTWRFFHSNVHQICHAVFVQETPRGGQLSAWLVMNSSWRGTCKVLELPYHSSYTYPPKINHNLKGNICSNHKIHGPFNFSGSMIANKKKFRRQKIPSKWSLTRHDRDRHCISGGWGSKQHMITYYAPVVWGYHLGFLCVGCPKRIFWFTKSRQQNYVQRSNSLSGFGNRW